METEMHPDSCHHAFVAKQLWPATCRQTIVTSELSPANCRQQTVTGQACCRQSAATNQHSLDNDH